MTSEIKTIRPAILSAETKVLLDEYRKFRHLSRTIYSFQLNAEKIKGLVVKLPKAWKGFQRDLTDFIDQFLKSHFDLKL